MTRNTDNLLNESVFDWKVIVPGTDLVEYRTNRANVLMCGLTFLRKDLPVEIYTKDSTGEWKVDEEAYAILMERWDNYVKDQSPWVQKRKAINTLVEIAKAINKKQNLGPIEKKAFLGAIVSTCLSLGIGLEAIENAYQKRTAIQK